MQLNREKIQRMSKGNTMMKGGSGSGSGGSGGGGSADYAAEAGHALEADHALTADTASEATHATTADTATNAGHATTADTATNATNANHATLAANLDTTSTDWQKIARKDSTQSIAEVWTFAKGIISTLKSYFRAGIDVAGGIIADTLNLSGNATVGGTLGVTGKLTGIEAELQKLTVTKEMHVFKLTVDDLTSNKGAIIVTSANCTAEDVEEVTGGYTVYWENKDKDGNPVSNPWKVGDLALCLTYKGEGTGTFQDVVNRYYWRKVLDVQSTVRHGGDDKWYNTITLSNAQGEYEGSTVPAIGDNIVQLGYNGQTQDAARQTAVILSSYPTMDTGVTPPSLAFYKGINNFALASHRYTYIDGLNNEFMGNFKILVNGNYEDLTTVLATLEGLIMTVKGMVRGKNILQSDGWTDHQGFLLGATNYDEQTQMFSNSDGEGSYDDMLWSPVFFLKAGTYTYSHYCTDNLVHLLVYASSQRFSMQNIPSPEIEDIFVGNHVSGDTYLNTPRRYCTFTLDDDCYVCLNIFLSDDEFTMYRPMLEEGDTVSNWETGALEHTSQIKILANAINIAIRAGLRATGIYIDDGTIKLKGDKVTFCDSNGGNTDKIWIDPTAGNLHAVNAFLTGSLMCHRLVRRVSNEPQLVCFSGITADTLALLGDIVVVGGQYSGDLPVRLPPAKFFPGAHIKIINATYSTSGGNRVSTPSVISLEVVHNANTEPAVEDVDLVEINSMAVAVPFIPSGTSSILFYDYYTSLTFQNYTEVELVSELNIYHNPSNPEYYVWTVIGAR